MTERGKIKLRKIYTIAFSVLTILFGVLCICRVWEIYRSAPRKAFSVTSIGEAVQDILPLLIVWILAFIGNIVVVYIAPKKQEKLKAQMSSEITLQRLKERLQDGGKSLPRVRQVQRMKRIVSVVCWILICVACAVSLWLLLDKNYQPRRQADVFTTHGGAADRILSTLPWICGGIFVAFFLAHFCEWTRVKEMDAIKEGIKQKSVQMITPAKVQIDEKKQKQKATALLVFRVAMYVAAVVLIIIGINVGGVEFVFEKARSICHQCIGLG